MDFEKKNELMKLLEDVYRKIEDMPLRGASQDAGVAAKAQLRAAYQIVENIETKKEV